MEEQAIYFPWLHPGFMTKKIPEWVSFLNPGIIGEDQYWRQYVAKDLPLDAKTLQKKVHEFLQYGGEFTKSGELRTRYTAPIEDFYTESRMHISSELQGGAPAESISEEVRPHAQLLLALEFYREKQFVDMAAEIADFSGAQKRFAQSLGLEKTEDFSDGFRDLDSVISGRENVDWRTLFAPLLCFLPPGAFFYITDTDILEEFRALEVLFTPCIVQGNTCQCFEVSPEKLHSFFAVPLENLRSVRFVCPAKD